MERKKPDAPNGWDFTVGGGRVVEDGKPHWPDCLTLWLRRDKALAAISSLAKQLIAEDAMYFALTYCGELEVEDA